MNLSSKLKITKLKSATAAGTGAVTSDILDMAGYETVLFVIVPGTVTAGAATSFKVQQGDNSALSDAADLEGSSQTIADDDDNQVFWSEIYRPTDRYLRVVVSRATQNAEIGPILAIQGGAREMAVDNAVADTIQGELHHSPDEGTA